jgi:hypothetical protein
MAVVISVKPEEEAAAKSAAGSNVSNAVVWQ